MSMKFNDRDMRNLILTFLVLLSGHAPGLMAQDIPYAKQISQHRKKVKEEHKIDPRSPLRKSDLRSLRYYPADESWKIEADYREFTQKDSVMMPTSSGRLKYFLRFARADFQVDGRNYSLSLYRPAAASSGYAGFFLPFYDQTNGPETYGGGRYLDLDTSHIKGGKILIDFNLSYNPWCAYSDGFNCPVPPQENRLELLIRAGEKAYKGRHRLGSKGK